MSFFTTDVNPSQSPLPPAASMQWGRAFGSSSSLASLASSAASSSTRRLPPPSSSSSSSSSSSLSSSSQKQKNRDNTPNFNSFMPGQSHLSSSERQMNQTPRDSHPPITTTTAASGDGSGRSGNSATGDVSLEMDRRRPSAALPTSSVFNAEAATATTTATDTNDAQQDARHATKLVDQCLARDEMNIELMEQETQMNAVVEDTFQRKSFDQLPEPLFEQYKNLEFKCFMGLFTEINRAWVTIDNKFFIWNFLTGEDFTEFEELDQVIISVGLVKPKKNVFKDFVRHLLVIATPVEIVLVAVAFSDGTLDRVSSPAAGRASFSSSEINLLPTNYSAPSDNVNMIKICGTENGRIFLCGQDGCLYELTYEAEEGWFRRKCKKLNHTQSLVGILVPKFMKFTSDQSIIDITVDKERNVLYTLTEDSLIDVYDLGTDGNSISKVWTLRRDTLPTQTLPQFIYIAPISKRESARAQLVAISTNGERFYFSIFAFPSSRRPNSLNFIEGKTLLSPNASGSGSAKQITDIPLIQDAFFGKGVSIMSGARMEGMDTLYCIALENIQASKEQTDAFPKYTLCETISTSDVQGKTLAIGEMENSEDQAISAIAPYNELARQYLSHTRQFVCLSNNGIMILEKCSPLDRLQRFLQQDSDDLIRDFFDKYGIEEACAMCLKIACSVSTAAETPGSHITGDTFRSLNIANPHISNSAAAYFVNLGSKQPPGRFQGTAHGRTESHPFGGPSNSVENAQSLPMYGAFYLYFSRHIRPLWNYPIFVLHSTDPTATPQISSRFSKNAIGEVAGTLVGLRRFLDQYQHVLVSDDPVHRKDLFGLYHLINRALQVLAFVEMVGECNLQMLMRPQWTSEERQKRLIQFKFKDFAMQQEGEDMMKFLVYLIVSKGSLSSVEELIRTLQERCSSFFNPKDLKEIKAFDLIQQAQKSFETNNFEASETLANKALMLYLKIADTINVDVVCRQFQKLQFYIGCVELALAAAKEKDPNNLALNWVQSGRIEHDHAGIDAYRARWQCYQCALNVLNELDTPQIRQVSSSLLGLSGRDLPSTSIGSLQVPSASTTQQMRQASVLSKSEREKMRSHVIGRMLNSKDELFHNELFLWMKDRGRESELLGLPSPFLESYLQRENDYEVLWQFYERREEYDKAAKVLLKSAELDPKSKYEPKDYTLEKRVQNLNKALMNARLANLEDILKVLDDKLKIARVQIRILSELQNMLAEHKENMQASRVQRQLLEEAILELDSKLITPEELYNDYANRFKLYESCLALLCCAGYKDVTLIQKLWKKIIDQNSGVPRSQLERKLCLLGEEFYDHDNVFYPLDYIIARLERYNSYQFSSHKQSLWIIEMLRKVGVSFSDLYSAYYRLYLYVFGNPYDVSEEQVPRGQIASLASVTTSDEDLKDVFGLGIDEGIKLNILCALTELLDMWFAHIRSPLATWQESQEFPEERLKNNMTDLNSLFNHFDKEKRTEEMKARLMEHIDE